nr:MAG TPA: hypothetical protein [Caudoviricetes sp.]
MLGGTAPVLVFNFASISSASILNKLGFNIGEDSIFNLDIPIVSIPVYLDEKLTGILLDDHERSINIEFEQDENHNYERVISSDVKVTLKAQKDNVAFQGFLALFEQILKRVNYQAYKIYFYYDDVFMTNASLKDFAVTTMENTDTRVVTFTLTNRSEESKVIESVLKKFGETLKVFK